MDMIFHVVFLGAVSLFLVGSAFFLSFLVRITRGNESAHADLAPDRVGHSSVG